MSPPFHGPIVVLPIRLNSSSFRDKTTDDKLMQTPNDNLHIVPLLKTKIIGYKVLTFQIESLFKTLGTSIIYSPMPTPFLDQSRLLKIHVTFV